MKKSRFFQRNHKKLYAIFGLAAVAVLVVSAFVPMTALAAPVCTPNPTGPISCVDITNVSPSSPAIGSTFTVTVQMTGRNFIDLRTGGPLTSLVGVELYLDVTGSDPIIGANQTVSLTGDASGNVSKTFTFSVAAASPIVLGANQIYAKTVTQNGATAETGRTTVTVVPATASGTPGLTIACTPGAGGGGGGTDPSGLSWNCTATYIPAGSTTPQQPAGVTIVWDFGDGSSANGYTTTHRYATAGTYIVTARAVSADGTVLAQGGPITINTASTKMANQQGVDNPFRTIVFSFLSPIFMAIQAFIFLIYWIAVIPLITATASIQTGVGACTATGGTGFVTNICSAWQLIRNLVNMVFILFMIIIGIATILRLQSYNYKKLLGKLIIMAILVNFSLVIAQAILKLADILQFAFVGDLVSSGRLTRLGYDLIAFHFVSVGGKSLLDVIGRVVVAELTQIPIIAAESMNLLFSFMAFVVMAIIAVYLLIRLIALWILLIFSPFAYAFLVIPTTAGLAKQWWTNFFKYAFFTPIMFFFISLAANLKASGATFFDTVNYCVNLTGNAATSCTASMGFFAETIFSNLSNIVILAFLFASLLVAKKLAIAGSAALTSFGQKAMMLPLVAGAALGGAAVGATGRWYSGYMGGKVKEAIANKDFKRADKFKALSLLRPTVVKKAWEDRKKEKEFEATEATAGHARDFLNRYMPTEWRRDEKGQVQLGQQTMYGRIGEKAIINYKKGEWEKARLSEEEKNLAVLRAENPHDIEALEELHIEGRHEDGKMITAAKKVQNERMTVLTEQYRGQGNDELASKELARQQVKREIQDGSLPEATYDAVADWINQTRRLRKMGLSAGEVGNVGSAQSELSEQERKLRGLGQEVRLGDTFYSTADPEYWKALEQQEGSTAMLQKMQELKLDNMVVKPGDMRKLTDAQGQVIQRMNEKTGQMEDIEVPVQLTWQVKDADGNVVREHAIKDFQDLDKTMEATDRSKGIGYGSGNNLLYETTGALKAESAEKRLLRGNTEEWGAAFEPAAWMQQNEDGTFTRFTSYGKRQIRGMSSAQVNSFNQSRRMQSRAMKIGGFYVDDDTGDTQLEIPDIFGQLVGLNQDLAVSLTQKGDFTDKQADAIVQQLNVMTHQKKIRDKQGRILTFERGKLSNRGGYGIKAVD